MKRLEKADMWSVVPDAGDLQPAEGRHAMIGLSQKRASQLQVRRERRPECFRPAHRDTGASPGLDSAVLTLSSPSSA